MLGIIDFNCIGLVQRSRRHWNFARTQLEIAARRGTFRPGGVARELSLGETEKACRVLYDAV